MFAAPLQYERQTEPRSCGAAALTMVYRSLGITCNQEDIWQVVASKSAYGAQCARAQTLAKDALDRGLRALAFQVRDPWIVLERCLHDSVRVIINHAPASAPTGGHYSVLTDLNDREIIFHDPSEGPNQAVSRRAFLLLWNPRSPFAEILGQVMIAIAASESKLESCLLCKGQARDVVKCRSCRRQVRLQPLAILGCLTDWCPMRGWEQIFCPWCDHTWTKGLGA